MYLLSQNTTLLLVYINDLPDEVLSRIGIYADETTFYSSLGKSGVSEKVESAGELDLCSFVEWGERWLVTFNAIKTKQNCFLSITIETLFWCLWG